MLVFSRMLGGAPAAPPPILTVIPLPSATPVPTDTPTPSAVPETQATLPPELGGQHAFSPGQLVSISGTEGEGLRLRDAPGLNSSVRLVALENEVFEVMEGPVAADGYTWWRLTNPYDRSKDGWGADQYLRELDS